MYSARNNRLLFLKTYGELCVMPLLQRNTILLENTVSPFDTLASRQLFDEFVAVDKNFDRRSWSTTSGKLRKTEQLDQREIDILEGCVVF